MKATAYFTKKEIIKGEYKPTSLDAYKKQVDFLCISAGNRMTIEFNHPVELKESRSISRANCGGYVYYVTDKALKLLKEKYSWSCDF